MGGSGNESGQRFGGDRYSDNWYRHNSQPVAIVTGVKRYSIGESIVQNLLDLKDENNELILPNLNIITISRSRNEDLEEKLGGQGLHISMDLNPLSLEYMERNMNPFDFFQRKLHEKINNALKSFQQRQRIRYKSVDFLFNNSGVYDFGPLTETSNQSISTLIGVNYVGHVMTAKTVMKLNQDNGFDNSKNFRLCEVGSFQGVDVRAGSPVYSPSKAVGIDFCQSLERGNEVENVVYIAVGPVDTYMLHANHWVTKAGGDKQFIDEMFESDLDMYKAIFLGENQDALNSYINKFKKPVQEKLKETFSNYLEVRKKYAKTERFATEDTDDIGRDIVLRMLKSSKDYPSDIMVFDKQYDKDSNNSVRRYASRPLNPELENGYDKLSSIITDNTVWKELN